MRYNQQQQEQKQEPYEGKTKTKSLDSSDLLIESVYYITSLIKTYTAVAIPGIVLIFAQSRMLKSKELWPDFRR